MYLCDGERAAKRVRRLGIRRGVFFALISFKVVLGTLKVRNGENHADPMKKHQDQKNQDSQPTGLQKKSGKKMKRGHETYSSFPNLRQSVISSLPGTSSIYPRHVSTTTLFHAKKKGKTYRPNTRVLELLDRLWFALDSSFLFVRQLLCNLRRHDTVGCERARAVLSEKKKGSVPMGKINTHWYLRRSVAQIRRRKHGWPQKRKKM